MADKTQQSNPLESPRVPKFLNHNDEELPAPKRRKIPLACSACRDRKSRCDGGRPICSACEKRKTATQCLYEESTLKTQRDIAVLENRVRELEGTQGSNASSVLGHQESPSRLKNTETPFRQSDTYSRDLLPSTQSQLHRHGSFKATYTLNSKAEIDVTISDLLTSGPVDGENEHLFGKSSTASFIQSLKQTVLQSHATETSQISQNNITMKNRTSRVNRSSETSPFSLPARREADRYLNSFWEYMHPAAPILHKPSFMASYKSLWLSGDETDDPAIDDPIFLSTLSIVFAIGCQYTEAIDPSRRAILTERFYHQSRTLISIDELDSVSLMSVQLLLLTGIYLLNSKYTNRCWNLIGLAIRNAQSLGLHEENRRHRHSQIEREIRRRVWHNCVFFDRLVATVFGRPHMISSPPGIPLPMLIDDEYLSSDNEAQQPVNTISYLGLFVSSLKLFDIMSDVLKKCYQRESTHQSHHQEELPWWRADHLDDILNFDNTLDDFWNTLPPHLKIQHNNPEQNAQDMQWRQAKILRCRFLYIRALLLRPLLLSLAKSRSQQPFYPSPNSSPLSEQVALQICQKCIETVHELVTAIYSSLHINYQTPEWVTHYTFSCAMVLAAARLCSFPEMEIQSSDAAVQLSWSRCIAILLHYKEYIPAAPYAVQVLEALGQRGGGPSSSVGAVLTSEMNQSTEIEGVTEKVVLQDFNPDWSYGALPDISTDFDFNWMGQI